MNKIACEACGSNELIKQDGVFVCQFCGMKYSPDDVKRLVIDGTVDVSGSTVKVDNASFVEKYLANARRAKQKEDWEEVEKYYNLVEQNDPTNIEAIFYSSYGKARLSMVEGDIYKRQQICGVFCNCISVIDDNYNIEKSEANEELISLMNKDLFEMYGTSFVYTSSQYGDNKSSTYKIFIEISLSFIESLENIIKVDDKLVYWKMIYSHYRYIYGNKAIHYDSKERKKYEELAISIGKKIQEKDASFQIDEFKLEGCYVATAVYGSYDCPQVWTLRRYRDYTLAKTWYGRAFIHTYYAISPTLVKWFGKTNWFKNMWKPKLDKMVKELKAEGVEDTPYNDVDWR